MEQKQMVRQIIEFNKFAFDNAFSGMVMLQDQAEKMTNSFLEQVNVLPEEGKKITTQWMSAYKKGCDEFKKTVDDNFKKAEELIASL
jgi:phage-related minor tail protein